MGEGKSFDECQLQVVKVFAADRQTLLQQASLLIPMLPEVKTIPENSRVRTRKSSDPEIAATLPTAPKRVALSEQADRILTKSQLKMDR